MTDTLQRPAASPAGDDLPTPPQSGVVTGALAALRAVLTGLLLVVVVLLAGWAADDRSAGGAAEVVRAGARVWLLAHGTSLELAGGAFSLTPLGLTALPLVLVWRAGRRVSRSLRVTSVRGAAGAALAVAVPYATLTGAVASLTGTPAVVPSPVSALLGGSVLALTAAGAGALSTDRLWRAAWHARGDRTRRVLRAAAICVTALAGAAALLVAGSLAVHGSRTAELFATTAPGPLGALALLLVGLACLPTAVVWALCWLAGPGFAVGTGTAVGPFGHELGAVPALPLLGALPAGGLPTWVGVLVLLVPLAAGALAGRDLHRSGEGQSSTALVLDVAVTALWSGAGVAVLAALSGGAAGGQRLAEVGPAPWACGLAVAVEVGTAALVTAGALRRRGTSWRRHHHTPLQD